LNHPSSRKMPVVFVGHGSPQNVLFDNNFTRDLKKLGQTLPSPRAILVISAHWLTKNTLVSCTEKPQTIYDFYGFPEEMYSIKYPCPGAPDLARRTKELIKKAPVICDMRWGLDHGAWTILKHMYSKADIPVYQLSLDYQFHEWNPKPIQFYYELGKDLAPLRNQGVLIIGSGNITHNLGVVDFENIDAEPMGWAQDFDDQVREALLNQDHSALINYNKFGKLAYLAVPTLDHYLPMIYVLGLQEKGENITFFHEGFQYGSISMRGFWIS